MQVESEFEEFHDPVVQRYLDLLGVRLDHQFVPNLFEILSVTFDSVSSSEEGYPWLDAEWLVEVSGELGHCKAKLDEWGFHSAASTGSSGNVVRGQLSKFPRIGFLCLSSLRHAGLLSALKILYVIARRYTPDAKDPLTGALASDLRKAFGGTDVRSWILKCESNWHEPVFISSMIASLKTKPEFSAKPPIGTRLVEFLESMQVVLDVPNSVRQPRVDKVPSTTKKSKRKSPGYRQKKRNPPKQYVPPQDPAAGKAVLVGFFKPNEEGYPEPKFYVQEEVSDTPPPTDTANAIEVALRAEAKSRYWLRTFGTATVASRFWMTELERKRFLNICAQYLKAESAIQNAVSLSHLIAYLTPFTPEQFLYESKVYRDHFTAEGRLRLEIVRPDSSFNPVEEDLDRYRALLTDIELALPVDVQDAIAKLRNQNTDESTSFLSVLSLSRRELVPAMRKFRLELSDGGRYEINVNKIGKALKLSLDDKTENSGLTYMLAGRSTDMYPTLIFYWGGSAIQLKKAYTDSILEMIG